LKGCTFKPWADSAAHRPTEIVVLPDDLWAAEIRRRDMAFASGVRYREGCGVLLHGLVVQALG